MEFQQFAEIVKSINEVYGTSSEEEHKFIHEFFEGPIPLFKLILSQLEEGQSGTILVSFHLEMPTPDAIQWFLRVRQLDNDLHLAECYMRDVDGTSYVGQDAEILRMYTIEQAVINAWLQENPDVSTEEPESEPPKLTPVRVFADYPLALAEFQKMNKKKGDIVH